MQGELLGEPLANSVCTMMETLLHLILHVHVPEESLGTRVLLWSEILAVHLL